MEISEQLREQQRKSIARRMLGGLRTVLRGGLRSRLSKVGFGIIVAVLLLVIIGSFTVPYAPNAITGHRYSPPSYQHIFGTDYLGQDILSQVVWGAYPSLGVSLYTALASTLIGFLAGVYSGYFSRLEPIIGGITDVVMTFPALPLLIIIGMIFLANDQLIAISLIVVLWAPVARAVRSQTLSVKKLAFVESAKSSGMDDNQIVWRVVMFQVAPIAVAYFVINLSLGLVFITALEFLGVGNPLDVTWGSILYWAQQYAFNEAAWWWVLAPGAIIALTTTGFALIGYSVEEIMNPRLRTT